MLYLRLNPNSVINIWTLSSWYRRAGEREIQREISLRKRGDKEEEEEECSRSWQRTALYCEFRGLHSCPGPHQNAERNNTKLSVSIHPWLHSFHCEVQTMLRALHPARVWWWRLMIAHCDWQKPNLVIL